jgi:hypothetical protein
VNREGVEIVKMERATWFAAILLLAVASSCTTSHPSTNESSSVIPMQLFYFSSLPEMVATSDLVIEGTVKSVEPGRVVGEGDAAIQFGQVTLSVNRVLFGKIEFSSVVLEEFGLESGHPSQVGDHGVYFLTQKNDGQGPQFFRIVNSQGRFLDDGDSKLIAIDDQSVWVKLIEGMSLSELEAEVDVAATAVRQGRVEPAKPNFGQG